MASENDSYLLACEMKSNFRPKFKKKQPANIYKGNSSTSDTWLVKCTWNEEAQKFDIEEEMSQAMLIIDWKVESVCEYAKN